MEERITEVEGNLETRRLEGNAHKEGLGFGWTIMRCSFPKEDPMQQLANTKTLALPLTDDTTTKP